ncbi:MAG: bifunctional YncE family protein/alkaline phosphatase family protein [Acidobacteriaceae bacterium]|nr:bifunctional YncE family protein/alkaline phosphatase family protein [Acidobacteriaceae bacterium]
MKTFALLAAAVAGLLALVEAVPQNAPQERVGPLPGGGFLLNSGWAIRPAGRQVAVDTLPLSMAVSNNGKYLLVMNAGYNPPSISMIEVASKKEIGRTPLPDCWLGLTVAPKGDVAYVGGGSHGAVYELSLDPSSGALARKREFAAVPNAGGKEPAFIGDVAVSPDQHLLYAADLYNDSISVINLQSGMLIGQWKCGRRPYRILVMPGGKELVVSSWADAAIYQYDANTGSEIGKTRIAAHPTDMVWVSKPAAAEEQGGSSYIARIYVAASNTNSVYAVGVTHEARLNVLEAINVSTSPMHPLGMTPSALAADAAGDRLYVVCSDANAVAVTDISSARSRVLGFIPTGWYPTAARVLSGDQLVVANGKGLGSRANPEGPNPTRRATPLGQGGPEPDAGYIPHIQTGTVAFLALPENEQLAEYTRTVLENSPYRDDILYGPMTDQQQIRFSRSEGHDSPIQHAIYIIKENRTYDQVLGDLGKGNGDQSLTLFGEKVTPNLHQLAREFITYDNFYENADVSADGHNWANAAIAPDYTVKTWPNEYAGRRKKYDYEGGEPANTPPAGYLWDNALQAGLTVRDYGEWTDNIASPAGPRQIAKVMDAAIEKDVDMNYRGWDLEYPDVNRAQEFIREWKEFDAKGQAPQLMIVRLGNDHTEGTKAGHLTPFAFAADNDYAVGLVAEAVSHSKLWSSTAIFVIEDDAQNGPDHVDSHRAPAWVISAYTHRGIVDSTMYNQMSILRTMELILGLRPMTHFDAAARPMFGTFSDTPDARPYTAMAPKVSTTERNPANAPGASKSARMDFTDADKVDDDELNDVLWRAIKHAAAPPPTRSGFTK